MCACFDAASGFEVRSLRNGRPVMLRQLGPADGPLLQDFVRRLSPHSRRMRFQTGLSELYPALLDQLTRAPRPGWAAFAAVVYEQGRETLVGEARYAPSLTLAGDTEFALVVADDWQDQGLGAVLIDKIVRHAVHAGTRGVLHGDVLVENRAMLHLARRLGFASRRHPDGAGLALVTLALCAPARAAQPEAATFARGESIGSSSAAINA